MGSTQDDGTAAAVWRAFFGTVSIIQLVGDISHLTSLFLLCKQIHSSRSCKGEVLLPGWRHLLAWLHANSQRMYHLWSSLYVLHRFCIVHRYTRFCGRCEALKPGGPASPRKSCSEVQVYR